MRLQKRFNKIIAVFVIAFVLYFSYIGLKEPIESIHREYTEKIKIISEKDISSTIDFINKLKSVSQNIARIHWMLRKKYAGIYRDKDFQKLEALDKNLDAMLKYYLDNRRSLEKEGYNIQGITRHGMVTELKFEGLLINFLNDPTDKDYIPANNLLQKSVIRKRYYRIYYDPIRFRLYIEKILEGKKE